MPILRPYGKGSGADVWMCHEKAGSSSFATSGDWTPGAGDVKVSIDGAANANIGTLPAYDSDALAWKYVFADAELAGKCISIIIRNAALKDDQFFIETTDHHSAQHPNGVVRYFTPAGIAATTVTLDAGAGNTADQFKGMQVEVVESDVAADVGATMLGDSSYSTGRVLTGTKGWSRTPTGTVSNLRCIMYVAGDRNALVKVVGTTVLVPAGTGNQNYGS